MEKTQALQILLVDDDKSLLDILGTLLELDGHAVVKASSAHEGLLTMRKQGFDLVLVDLKMPRTTGLDMLRAIREDSPDTKVVIMTAYASVNSTVEAMRLGVFDYLPKPFKLVDLRAVLDRVQRNAPPVQTPPAVMTFPQTVVPEASAPETPPVPETASPTRRESRGRKRKAE